MSHNFQTVLNRWLRNRFTRAPWFNQQTFWLGVVVTVLLSIQAISAPPVIAGRAAVSETVTPTPAVTRSLLPAFEVTASPGVTPTDTRPTPTPFPPELIANREQTNGIIAGTILLLLIVIIGTLSGIRAHPREL